MDGNKEIEVFVADDGTLVDREVHEIVPQPRPQTRKDMRDDMKKVCALSDEQANRIAALDAALDKAASKWQAENGPKVQKAQMALFTSRDPNVFLKGVQELEELKKPYKELVAKAAVDVQAVLTPEQLAKWQEHAVIDLSIGVWFARAKLTQEQQAAVKAAYAELAKAKDAQAPALQIALAEKVRDLLTAEQFKAMAAYMMQTERSFHISTSGPATQETGAQAKSPTSVDGGVLMLPVPKLMKTGVLVVMGGYAGIAGPQAVAGNTIAVPDSEE
jgi:hypothetical protein